MTVAKLRGARERKRRKTGGKVEGRKSWAEIDPKMVEAAKRLRGTSRRPAKSLREIAVELKKRGFVNERGAVFSASSIASMLG